MEHGNGTLRVFRGWAGDLRAQGPELLLLVQRPLRLKALWDKYYRVELYFTSADGSPLTPQPALFMLDGRLVNESALWLKPGEHSLGWALWRGVKVRALTNFVVRKPGVLEVPLAVWRPLIRVTDFLGLPIPFAELVLAGPLEARTKLGLDAYGRALPLPEGVYKATVMLWGLTLGQATIAVRGDEVETLRVLLNPYLLLLVMVMALLVAIAVWRRSSYFSRLWSREAADA